VWANITANPIFNENGLYNGALAMVTDVTENRLAEELLKKSEANLRTVFDNTDIAFVFFNTEYDILSYNSPAAEFYREYFDRILVVGVNAFKYFPGDKKSDFEKIIRKVENRELVNYETKFPTKNNGIKWHEVKWVSVLNEQNEHIGILLTFKNITERKLLELEREKITADLIQRNKDQEQFNYMISHNLRAPVANIIGLSEILGDPDMDETDKKEILAGISQSVKSLDEVITDMNNVLQLKDLMNEVKETNTLINLVNDIKLSISNMIKKEQVTINCSFDVENIFSIKSYLYSIFYNLILNSIKYRKTGIAPVISITSSLKKNKVELIFTDNGKGINLHHNGAHLFGLYKRFDNTVEGKGLGLYMVKTQVESLGGTIKVKSEPDKGTQFIIELPF
jgi:PAS domain S-box-containing protein